MFIRPSHAVAACRFQQHRAFDLRGVVRDAKLDAIRAVLRRAKRPLTLREIQPRLENRLKQIIGRGRLYRLLGVIACTTGEIVITGKAESRAYALGKAR